MTFGRSPEDQTTSAGFGSTQASPDAPYGQLADGFGGHGAAPDGFGGAPRGPVQLDVEPDRAGGDAGRAGDIADAATAGPGRDLPHLDTIQQAFGPHDVRGIRAHTDDAAAHGSAQLGAHAFATGNDVAFAAPSPDLHTAAHEAAHVVQQRGGVQLKDGLGESGDTYEQHADAVADAVVRGESAAGLLGPVAHHPGASVQRRAVQRFDGDEHQKLGNEVGGQGPMRELSHPDLTISYGDVVMLAGDLYDSVDEIRTLSTTPAGRDELRYALWFAREASTRGPEPKADGEIQKRVKLRYDNLSADNSSHFSAGGSAASTYMGHHMNALRKAYMFGKLGVAAYWDQALTDEAFSQHFLSDMFSAGHVRTPRAAWEQADASAPIPSNDRIVQYLAYRVYKELDRQGDFGHVMGVIPTTSIPGVPRFIWNEKIEPKIKESAGPAIEAVSASDLLAKVQHDVDGVGLDVVSDRDAAGRASPGGHTWHAVGDSRMVERGKVTDGGHDTFEMAKAAMNESLKSLERMVALAKQETGSPHFQEDLQPPLVRFDRALDFVPAATTHNAPVGEGGGGIVDRAVWNRNIDEVFRRAVVPRLRSIYPEEEVIKEDDLTLHVGLALKRVADSMQASPHLWLEDALAWDYVPPVNDVPAGVPPQGPPLDSGTD